MLVDKHKVSSPLSVDAIPYDTLFLHSHSMFDCTLEMAFKEIIGNESWIEKRTWRVVEGKENFLISCVCGIIFFEVVYWFSLWCIEKCQKQQNPQSLSRHTPTISTKDSSNFPWKNSNFDHSFISCKHNTHTTTDILPPTTTTTTFFFKPSLTIMNSTQREGENVNTLKNYWFALIKIHSSM